MKNPNFVIHLAQVREHLEAAHLLQSAGLGRYGADQVQAAARLLAPEIPNDPILQRIQAADWPTSTQEFRQHQQHLTQLLRHQPILIYPTQVKKWVAEWAWLMLLVVILVAGSAWVETLFFKRHVPGWDGGSEQDFHDPVALLEQIDKGVWYWVDFGKEGKLHNERLGNGEIKIKTTDFTIGEGWPNRQVSWYMKAAERGQIELEFAPNSPYTQVMIFMTDGDSPWRMSHVENDYYHLAASSLHNGRWYIFELNEQERAAGRFQVKFFKIMGANVAVSSLVVIYDESFHSPGGVAEQKQKVKKLQVPKPAAPAETAPPEVKLETTIEMRPEATETTPQPPPEAPPTVVPDPTTTPPETATPPLAVPPAAEPPPVTAPPKTTAQPSAKKPSRASSLRWQY